MTDTILGIDLGTTNSEVAVIENGQATIILDAANNPMLPSFVGLSQNGEILVGEAALNQYTAFPERTIKSIKRRMGSDESVVMGDESYSPQEISAMILKRLKEMAEAHIGHSVSKAVITVPAYFNDAQRQATREAGEIAGLEVVRMINEPTAAALAYESGHQGSIKILVYDLGGGTFDVSVVEIQDDVVEVISSHGNNHLGGDDFDQKIVEFLCNHLQQEHQLDDKMLADSQITARLLRSAIEAKINLSSQPFVMIEEEFIATQDGVPVNLSVELSRDDYEEMIMPFIAETLEAVHIALKDANLTSSDINEILLVGGSTRTPLIAQMLTDEIGLEPRGEINPDLCVATGAALQAGMIAGEAVSMVLVDITPHTFGTSVFGEMNGLPYPYVYSPIIPHNTPIPVTRSEVYFTMVENQEAVQVEIYQGEDHDAQNNTLIGEFNIELGKAPANSPIVMELALDVSGLLHVTATEKNTGQQKSISIENATSRMDDSELESARKRVGALFGDADIDNDNEANTEATESVAISAANALVEKAQKMLDDASDDDREDIVNLLETIQDAINENNDEALTEPVEQLTDILYYLES